MDFTAWLRDHLIKEQKPNHAQIRGQLSRARKDLLAAEALFSSDKTWSFTIAYHATMRACKALMFSKGFLPTTKNPHKTILAFAHSIFGDESRNLFLRLDRMRRRRHDFIYDADNDTTESEARSAISTAQELMENIRRIIGENSPGEQ